MAVLGPMPRMIREVKRELLRPPLKLAPEQVQFIQSPAFTRSDAWVRLRYDFMRDHDGRCRCCGRRATDGVKVNADHILPRRTHPQLALCYANLQVLCGPCNRGKGNRDRTDWRFRGPSAISQIDPPSTAAPRCPACRAAMNRREGPHGCFWGCSRFPVCRATRPCDDRAPRDRRHHRDRALRRR
jgi:Topoisomerase DNA binding C4 zinc finger/HNH endonuclease